MSFLKNIAKKIGQTFRSGDGATPDWRTFTDITVSGPFSFDDDEGEAPDFRSKNWDRRVHVPKSIRRAKGKVARKRRRITRANR